jgi:hypothetical protein
MGRIHLTGEGIEANRTFSVNILCEDLVMLTDHVGIVLRRAWHGADDRTVQDDHGAQAEAGAV